MFCPNGNLTLNQLLNMLYSKEYDIWFEPNDEPEDWDWKKNGFYRSPNKTRITTKADLLKAIQSEYDKEGKIIYDNTDEYYKRHPYVGEAKVYRRDIFTWQYSSPFGAKRCYRICECSYLGESPEYVPLEIVCYEDGFNSSCFQIGSWDRTSEGYEFKSCGSRFFEYVSLDDLPEIWKAIKAADLYLNERFIHEQSCK